MSTETPLATAYLALLALAGEQQRALVADDLPTFFKLGTQREACFATLKALELAGKPTDVAQRDRLRSITRQILTIDDDLEARLLERQNQTRAEIARLQPGIHALQAYVSESSRSAFFIDRSQ